MDAYLCWVGWLDMYGMMESGNVGFLYMPTVMLFEYVELSVAKYLSPILIFGLLHLETVLCLLYIVPPGGTSDYQNYLYDAGVKLMVWSNLMHLYYFVNLFVKCTNNNYIIFTTSPTCFGPCGPSSGSAFFIPC
jgi:hypothetical protein